MKRINPKKLLPSAVPAGGSVGTVSPNILIPASNITAKTYAKVAPEENTPQKSKLRAQTFQLKTKIIEVSKLFSIKNKFTKDKNRKKRIEEERKRREQREKESEKTTFNFGSGLPKLVLPRTGFLDSIKRFLLYSLLGFAVNKFLPLVPRLLEFGKILIPAMQFLVDFAGNFLVNMVNFIDRGYRVYDGIKEQLDRIIPSDISQQFSKFSGLLNTALNTAILLGIAGIGSGGLGRGVGSGLLGGLRKTGSRGGSRRYGRASRFGISRVDGVGGINYRKGRVKGETFSTGDKLSGRRIDRLKRQEKLTFDGKSTTDMSYQQRKGERDVMKRYVDRFGRKKAIERFGSESVNNLGGKYSRSTATNTVRRGIAQTGVSPIRITPRQEVAKGVSKFKFGKFRGAGPGIFGALLDFGISLATGEPVDRALVSAIGAGLGGWIGGVAGSIVPVLGTIIGGTLGSMLGSIITLSLYDTIRGRDRKISKPKTDDEKKKEKERMKSFQELLTSGSAALGGIQTFPYNLPNPPTTRQKYSISDLVQLALSVGFKKENAAIAAAIAMAESGGNPTIDTVKSGLDPEKKNEFSIGLWQINMRGRLGEERRKKFNIENNDLYNPNLNAQIAYKISGGYNFNAWTTYTGGKYKTYLPAAEEALKKSPTTQVVSKPQSSLPSLPPTNTIPGQQYGAKRTNGTHAGVDFDISENETFYSRIGGEVTGVYSDPGGYGNYVDIYNKQLGVTERIAEGAVVLVSVGDIVQPGKAIVRGESETGVIHYEIRNGRAETYGFGGTLDPIKFLNSLPKKKASISKPTTTNIATGIDEQASYDKNDVLLTVLPIKQIVQTPVPTGGGGGGTIVVNSNSSNIFSPALIG